MRTILLIATLLLAGPLHAEGLALLRVPGVHAIMRHAQAPGGGDPPGFRIDAPETQRRLSDEGRAQAREAGAAIRATGATVETVLTSQWDRCRETARLLDLGPVADAPALNSFFQDRSTRDAQTNATRALIAALPEDANAMLVTHQVNVTALTGVFPASGEIVLFRMTGGAIEVLDRVRPPYAD
jgi:phosphohistidine phosphatase SixA